MPGAEHPGAIGSDRWPGLSKLMEECAEVTQVAAKIAAFPFLADHEKHPDGTDLVERLEDEIGDLLAILDYVTLKNSLNTAKIKQRRKKKMERFMRWDREERARRARRD